MANTDFKIFVTLTLACISALYSQVSFPLMVNEDFVSNVASLLGNCT